MIDVATNTPPATERMLAKCRVVLRGPYEDALPDQATTMTATLSQMNAPSQADYPGRRGIREYPRHPIGGGSRRPLL
ncbi:unnamed protein product [Mesocestoides corti]|uniref:Kinesin motor domain-containing protein n=1 Tax=Mesocestoides corti TaxID=53468 RepID=A0A0R3UBH8_MESCO|nr:unnamed protein product [Mesocestoides corti]